MNDILYAIYHGRLLILDDSLDDGFAKMRKFWAREYLIQYQQEHRELVEMAYRNSSCFGFYIYEVAGLHLLASCQNRPPQHPARKAAA